MAPPKSQNNTAAAAAADSTTKPTSSENNGSTTTSSTNGNTSPSASAKTSTQHTSSSSTSSTLPSLSSHSSSNATSASRKQGNQSSSSYSSVLPRMSDPTPPPSQNSRLSSAMSSSRRSSKDASDSGNAAGSNANSSGGDTASPYGTRSRNRTGGVRPNYAEDKDIDMDIFEPYQQRGGEESTRKSSTRHAATSANGTSSAAEREPLRSTNGSGNSERVRKPLPTSSGPSDTNGNSGSHGHSNGNSNNHGHGSHTNSKSSSHASHKEQTQSSSSGSHSHSSNSRKRKAATAANDKSSSNSNSNPNGSQVSSGMVNISLRKNGPVAAAAAAAAAAVSPQNSNAGYPETNLMTFEKHGAKPNKDNQMLADDGSVLGVNDHVYLVCEPPGEPYYLARVMEFLHAKNNPSLPVDALRVNWYYRPRDIGRKSHDTRYVFATMHSDVTPLTALRGLCTIKHKAEIESMEQFRRTPNCFWFDKLYDRYIQKNYEVIPTFQIVNVPERVKKVLDERWRYVLVEQGRGKDLTSAAKQCKRCAGFCASNNSVDCAVCGNTYHMNCVRPPLLKKPSRGFAWSCAACSRAQERLLEARQTPNLIDGRTPDSTAAAVEDDELFDEDDDECPAPARMSTEEEEVSPTATPEQQYQASLWPYRYLGMHCKVEDALDYDDRIYPRAATRVGPRHQAVVQPWPGKPVQYVNPPDIKKATRREARQNKEALAAYEREREKRPKWIQDTPPGYIERGGDWPQDDPRCTNKLLFTLPRETVTPDPDPTDKQDDKADKADKASKSGKSSKSKAEGKESKQPSEKATKPKDEKVEVKNEPAAEDKMDIDTPEANDQTEPKAEESKAEPAAEVQEEQKDKKDKPRLLTHAEVDAYMAKVVAKNDYFKLPPRSTNLYDMGMILLFKHHYDTEKALEELDQKKYSDFKEPLLTAAEQKRFEEAVTQFGSEIHLIVRHVKTVPFGQVTRFYYTWKKSERGKQVWGNSASRKGKKEAKEAKKAEAEAASKFLDDVADDNDDSGFDTDKATRMKRQFLCKFCHAKSSRQWRRAPAIAPPAILSESVNGGSSKHSNRDRNHNQNQQQYVVALCRRCSELWRRYAVLWEDLEALAAKATSNGSRLAKRKNEEDLMKEITAADEMIRATEARYNALHAHSTNSSSNSRHNGQEPPRKRLKGHAKEAADKEDSATESVATSTPSSSSRRRDRSDKNHGDKNEKGDKGDKNDKASASHSSGSKSASAKSNGASAATTAPPAPEIPEPRQLPCAVCYQFTTGTEKQRVSCRDCRLTVHRGCYGIPENRNASKWTCDMCANDRSPQVSIDYRCVLCPVEHTDYDYTEPPRTTHKKKTEKDRERERAEREQAIKSTEYYRKRQLELNKPQNPREALKRTADNNWVHVTCAVWTPEVKFGNALALEPSEGIPSVPRARYAETCKICRKSGVGACASCPKCRALFHIECAHQTGHIFGFDVEPLNAKTARRDPGRLVTIDGADYRMTAVIWCKEHVPLPSTVHVMHEQVHNSGMTALQLYVESYKQADLALTGCARKANLFTLAAKMSGGPASIFQAMGPSSGSNGNRRSSVYYGNGNSNGSASASASASASSNGHQPATETLRPGGKICYTCGTDISPKWYAIDETQERELTNGYHGKLGIEARKFAAQRNFQCHKCKKAGRQASPHGHIVSVKTEEEFQSGGDSMQRTPSSVQSQAQQAHSQISQVQSQQSQPQPQPQPQPQTQLQHPHQVYHHHHHMGDHQPTLAQPMAPPLSQPSVGGITSLRSPDMGRYWSSNGAPPSSTTSLPPPPPPPHQVPPPPPPLSMRPSSRGSPPLVAHTQSPPGLHMHPRAGASQPPPPPPVHSYHRNMAPSPPSAYADWRRTTNTAGPPQPPPPPPRREPMMHSSSAIPPLVTHNHLRPPPLGGMSHSPSSSMQNGGNSAYMGRSIMNGMPPSPRTSSAPPMVATVSNASANSYGHAPYGTSPPMPPSRPAQHNHSPFAQVLHPQRSSSSSFGSVGLGASNVTREDFTTLGRDRGPASVPPRSNEPRGSSASSNASLRNLLS